MSQSNIENTIVERFADVQILKYAVPGFEKLSLKKKMLVYHLSEAGYWGRDIFWDQNFKYNLLLRNTLEQVYRKADADLKAEMEWKEFELFLKRVWFSNGIHHHYGQQKLQPGFSKQWWIATCEKLGMVSDERVLKSLFDPEFAAKKVVKDPNQDMVLQSAVNFYDAGITQAEVEKFYAARKSLDVTDTPISHGLNSRMSRNAAGDLEEQVYRVGGHYSAALEAVVAHLRQAITYAENELQGNAFELLVKYYETGDLTVYDQFSIAWLQATEGDVDFIHGFTEVYEDPLGYKGTFEAIIQLRDFEATQRMQVMLENIQWFEKTSPIPDAYKKEDVQGVTYSIMNVIAEAGDASPATPIGVNLPNADWIRAQYGSKSVSLINIENAYDNASGTGLVEAFSLRAEEVARAKKFGSEASKMHTALHEVIGHGSGKLKPGVATPKETLKNYSNTIEEARADLVALYFMMEPQLVNWGILSNMEVGKAAYDQYIRNGLQLQLRRLALGEELEEDHMRNRQLIAKWVLEQGVLAEAIICHKIEGKTFYSIADYSKLQELFGELLFEVQRIKSEGDYEAAKRLVEHYAVKVDPALHEEVLERVKALDLPPYSGFVNPYLQPVFENETLVDVALSYPASFAEQMLHYANKYGTLSKVESL